MKKVLAVALALVMMLAIVGCGTPKEAVDKAMDSVEKAEDKAEDKAEEAVDKAEEAVAEVDDTVDNSDVIMTMVTDVGGVNDESFNMLAWQGHQLAETEYGITADYIESSQESDYAPNLETAYDNGARLIWGIGFMMADSVLNAAEKNPDATYAIIDNNYDGEMPANLLGITFKEQEPSFMVGYIAAKMSKTGTIGFVGGMEIPVIERFECGFVAGANYANKDIKVAINYAGNFNDAAKGKAIAQKQMQDGADIIFHAAGGTGNGVIEAVVETGKPADGGKWVIGVDTDQNKNGPDNVLTSSCKTIDQSILFVLGQYLDGTLEGGQNMNLGYAEDGVYFATTGDHIPADILAETNALVEEVKAGTLIIPGDRTETETFVAGLK